MYEWTIPQFIKMLNNLSRIMDKAAQYADSKKFDVEVLMHSRLAPDQFHFIRQVQIACDTAKFCVGRLCGKETPTFEDNEKTFTETKARIEKVLSYLKTYSAKDFTGCEERRIQNPRWEGKTLSGTEYAIQHAIPNFYFHVTTAYSILRHNGVDVGKMDYIGQLPLK